MRRGIQIIECVVTGCGCKVPTSHSPGGDGYPKIKINRKWYRIHRLVYERVHGPIPEDKEIHHTCRNKLCCNPDHLKLVSRHTHQTLEHFDVKRFQKGYGLWLAGATPKEIASACGVKVSTVYVWVKRFKAGDELLFINNCDITNHERGVSDVRVY